MLFSQSIFRCVWTLWALMMSLNAAAHMMPAQQGTVNIVDKDIFVVVSLPISAFKQIDDDGNRALNNSELTQNFSAIEREVTARLTMRSATEVGKLDTLQVMLEPGVGREDSKNLLIMMKRSFLNPPDALSIQTDLFGTQAAEQQITIKATRDQENEVLILSPNHSEHSFFRSSWQVFAEYIQLGVEHILLGTDHLLFLLTIIVAAASWRYWLSVITSFTIAHSITIVLALLGMIQVSTAIVEPMIAASIVLMAVLNLRQQQTPLLQRSAIVFACGLLHGLGFASSLGNMGLSSSYRLPSIAGFNIGIELGQMVFLLVILMLMRLFKRKQLSSRVSVEQLVSVLAIIVGSFWLLTRI